MNVDLGPLDVEDVEVLRDALIFRCGITDTDYERSDVLVKWLTLRLALARHEAAVA